MRKLICLSFVLMLTNVLLAQDVVDTSAPVRRFPTVAPFKILQTDSVTFFSKDDLKKNKPVLVMLFSPGCEHCQHETEEILRKIDDLKNVQIVLATTLGLAHTFSELQNFATRYKLADYNNIHIGLDYQNMLPSFFRVYNLPYLAMYDKKGNLVRTFEGTMKIDDLVKTFH